MGDAPRGPAGEPGREHVCRSVGYRPGRQTEFDQCSSLRVSESFMAADLRRRQPRHRLGSFESTSEREANAGSRPPVRGLPRLKSTRWCVATAVCRGGAWRRRSAVPDSDDHPLVPGHQRVLQTGRPVQRRAWPENVLVIGAGPAGPLTAWLLKESGHRVTVLTADGNRAGGRVKTFRAGGHERAEQPFADPRRYAEAGAMRTPAASP
ncbi:NAD(P)-binding protein [Streptomyces sp. M92]|uniref:NAD(P)-binding protein n=1 Tax=Streptomyces sp. M92 TaxID=2944250 RepID=UPI00300E067E